jgi:hypothetical protein
MNKYQYSSAVEVAAISRKKLHGYKSEFIEMVL